jgi:hypothetical protein
MARAQDATDGRALTHSLRQHPPHVNPGKTDGSKERENGSERQGEVVIVRSGRISGGRSKVKEAKPAATAAQSWHA